MKRVVGFLLMMCMLISIMSVGVAAYADDAVPDVAVLEGEAEPQEEHEEQQEKASAEEGFFADAADDVLAVYNAELAKLGYGALDRAGMYALCVQLGLDSLDAFELWLTEAVRLNECAEASVDGQKFYTLNEALAVLDGRRFAAVKLESDAAANGVFIPDGKELVLDLNGHTLTLTPDGAGEPSYFIVAESKIEEDGKEVYSHSAVHIKNGTIAGCTNARDGVVIYNAGSLTLSNVAVKGSVSLESADAFAQLTVQPDEFGKTALFAGAIIAADGAYKSVAVTGGRFSSDVSAYVDADAYDCIKGEDGIYTVSEKGGTSVQPETPAQPDEPGIKLPQLTITAQNNAEVMLGEGAALENAALTLNGLKAALADNAAEMILREYEKLSSASGAAQKDGGAAFVSSLPDGTELTLTVKATLTEAEAGSSVTYVVSPCAVINGREIVIDNGWLNGTAMTMSFYTGFLPETLLHDHGDGMQPETIGSDRFSYNPSSGMVTLNVTSFSAFTAKAAGGAQQSAAGALQKAIDAAADGDTVSMSADEKLEATVTVKGKSVTVDLNGKKLEGGDAFSVFTVDNGTLTVVGSGTLDAKGGAIADILDGGAVNLGYEKPTDASYTGDDIGYYSSTAENKFIGGSADNVHIRRARLNFDPAEPLYVDKAVYMISNNGTTVTPIVAPTEWTVKLIPVARNINNVTDYETLHEAIAKANAGDKIALLADIGEGDITIDKSLTVETLTTAPQNYHITGNITVTGDTSADITLRRIAMIDGTVECTDKTSARKLTVNNCGITGGLKLGDFNSLTMLESTVSGGIISTGNSKTSMSLSSVSVFEEDGSTPGAITAGDNTTFTLVTDVRAGSLTAGSDTQEPHTSQANLAASTIGIIDLGSAFNRVSLLGVVSDSVNIGSNISGEILVHSGVLEGSTIIGTLTVGENDTKVNVDSGTDSKPTKIGTLTIGKGSVATLGGLLSDDAKDLRLQVNSVDSSLGGSVTIYSGCYNPTSDANIETLIGDDTIQSIRLVGGNYPEDYSQYCDCTIDLDKVHYTHYACNLITDKASTNYGRYRVGQFQPRITSPVSGRTEIAKGYAGDLTYITNVPYTHTHSGTSPQLVELLIDRGTASQEVTPADYSVVNANGMLGVKINGSYLSKLTTGTYYIKIDTEVGTAYRQSDNSLAGFRVKLSSSTPVKPGIQTGDEANIAGLAAVMALTGLAAAGAAVVLKKKKHD